MHIVRCTPEEYDALFPSPSHVFNSVGFNELNRHKCQEVHYLMFEDDKGKVRLGMILGQRDGMLLSPFSAPFGGMEERGEQSVSWYVEAVKLLKEYTASCGCGVVLRLPPAVYDSVGVYAKQFCSVMSCGGRTVYADYNYHYDLSKFPSFKDSCSRAARKNYAKSAGYAWRFEALDGSAADVERVYGVIKSNRDGHNYPLRMSLADVKATAAIIPCTFLVLSYDGVDVAAVLAYDVAPGISQVIYWGDVPGYSEMRPMNMLAYETFRHFASRGQRILDIGPSSEGGIPSFGLCDFKSSLGCTLTPKFTLEL